MRTLLLGSSSRGERQTTIYAYSSTSQKQCSILMNVRHNICGLIVTVLCMASGGVKASTPTYNVYLTTQANGTIEAANKDRQFDCSDVIYLFVESASTNALAAQLKAVWSDPAGKDRVTARREFQRGEGGYWSWSGLQLNRPAGASIMRLVDPAAGMDAFIGEWTVRVAVNDRTITTLNFDVLC